MSFNNSNKKRVKIYHFDKNISKQSLKNNYIIK